MAVPDITDVSEVCGVFVTFVKLTKNCCRAANVLNSEMLPLKETGKPVLDIFSL
jgi:hypothetical protein